eukprot:TRINITY_DN325_c9_g1_i1.p2 TRINITY_DN325_c9_g1~~TRINITY_DN325_c9_g1_i1.p2  ORF type:complete len:165 (+),score=59.31 TRINITY_DN325_c9_g1_i1:151-645(+)
MSAPVKQTGMPAFIADVLQNSLYIPSWTEVYVVPRNPAHDVDDDEDLESDDGVKKWEGQYNWAPAILGTSAFLLLAPRIALDGFDSVWAVLKEKAGIPSWKYTKTLYMSGELEWFDSFTGLASAIFGDRRSLFWIASCLATYVSLAPYIVVPLEADADDSREEG